VLVRCDEIALVDELLVVVESARMPHGSHHTVYQYISHFMYTVYVVQVYM